jgi:hypothetical protein
MHLDFKATNNMAEYEALIFGLSTMLSLGVQQLLVKGESQLIIKQVKGECSCNDPQLVAYLVHAQKLEKDFEVLDLQHVPHANNVVTDELSTKAFAWAPVPEGVFECRLQRPTTQPTKLGEGGEASTSKLAVPVALFTWSPSRIVGITGDSVNPDAQDPDAQASSIAWITEIQDYLKDQVPPRTRFKSRQRARRVTMCCHVPHSTGTCLSARVGSEATMCPVTPEPASLIRRALVPPCIPSLQTP